MANQICRLENGGAKRSWWLTVIRCNVRRQPTKCVSKYLVFYGTDEVRTIKNLTAVGDATHEEDAIGPEQTLAGSHLVRILEQMAITRGLTNGHDFHTFLQAESGRLAIDTKPKQFSNEY